MKSDKKLDFIFLKSEKSKKIIIGLHGWQGNKESFLPMAHNKHFQRFNWYLPEAPYLVNNNPQTKSWAYEKDTNVWEVEETILLLNQFFESEIFNNYDSKNVYVIGFSQGAAVCYDYICKLDKPLGAIFPVAGFLRNNDNIINIYQKNTPIIIGHGTQDDIVPIKRSMEAFEILKKQNANVEMVTYESRHNISNIMINKILNIIES